LSALVATYGTCNMCEQAKMQLSIAAPAVQECRSVLPEGVFGMCA